MPGYLAAPSPVSYRYKLLAEDHSVNVEIRFVTVLMMGLLVLTHENY
jgi:hypothetical protein